MFEQYLYTDNKQGYGLSVLNKSNGITEEFLGNMKGYTRYEAPLGLEKETTPQAFKDAYRYNCDFAASPMLMNIAYIGKEVTTSRNGNFVAHTLISSEPLQGYAIDYFLNDDLFVKSCLPHEVDGTRPPVEALPQIEDKDLTIQANIDEVIDQINNDFDFFQNLLQAVILAYKNNERVVMANYRQPLKILKMLYYALPVNLANQISFNTRTYSTEAIACKNLPFIENGEKISRVCSFGTVEIINFVDDLWSKSSIRGDHYFNANEENDCFLRHIEIMSWLRADGGVTKKKLQILSKTIEANNITELSGLIDIDEKMINAVMYPQPTTMQAQPKEAVLSVEPLEQDKINNDNAQKQQAPVIKHNQTRTERKKDIKSEPSPKKKRKFKVSILNIAIIIAVFLGVFFGIKKLAGDSNFVIGASSTKLVLDGQNVELSKWDSSQVKTKLGYAFDGYWDNDGVCVIDSNGNINQEYSFDNKKEIFLTSKWIPNENNITIVTGGDNMTFLCLTDESVIVPQEILNNLVSSCDIHMEFKGLSLEEGGQLVYEKTSDGEYMFNSPYGKMSKIAYQAGLESQSLSFYPVYKEKTMRFTFKDYYTKETLDMHEMVFSQNGYVPLDSFLANNNEYLNCTIYYEIDGVLSRVYSSKNWFGDSGRLTSYKETDVTLYVSRNVDVYFAGNFSPISLEYGHDLILEAREQLNNNNAKFKYANALFYEIPETKEYLFVESSDDLWKLIGDSTSICVYPAYFAHYRFFTYDLSSKDYAEQTGLTAECRIRLLFNQKAPVVEQFKYTGTNGAISNLSYNHIEIATANDQRWINEQQISKYSKTDRCILYDEVTSTADYIIEKGEINEDKVLDLLYGVDNENNTINLYSAYNPSTITIRFNRTDLSSEVRKEIVFGDTLESWDSGLSTNSPWGYEYIGWKSNNINLMYNDAIKNVKVDLGLIEQVNVSSGIIFDVIKQSYKYNLVVKFDNKIYTYKDLSTSDEISIGNNWTISGISAEQFYNTNYLNKKHIYNVSSWTTGWNINDSSIDISNGVLKITEQTLGAFITFESLEQAIDIEIEKTIEKRKYQINFNSYALEATQLNNQYAISNLNQSTLNRSPISFDSSSGTLQVQKCNNIVVNRTGKEYQFVAWKIGTQYKWLVNENNYSNQNSGNMLLTLDDGQLKDLYDLGALNSNGVVEITFQAVYYDVENWRQNNG